MSCDVRLHNDTMTQIAMAVSRKQQLSK